MGTRAKVAQAEAAKLAIQTVKNTAAPIRSSVLDRREVHEILMRAEQLEPCERHLAAVELATTVWLRSLEIREPLYSGFVPFLRSRLSERSDIEKQIPIFIDAGRVCSDAIAHYWDYLRGMFMASGKTRAQFYSDMLAETDVRMSAETFESEEGAEKFLGEVVGTLHEEHLLVFYCVRLVSNFYEKNYSSSSAPMTEEKLEIAYKYFEGVFPVSKAFFYYTNEAFLSYSLEQGDLVEIKRPQA